MGKCGKLGAVGKELNIGGGACEVTTDGSDGR